MADYDLHRALNEALHRHLRRDDVVLASGQRSNTYIDVKSYAMTQRGHQDLGYRILDLIPPGVTHVAGMELGGCPLVTSVMAAAIGDRCVDGLFVRKAPKGRGHDRMIEGYAPLGAHVVLLEDVVTTGASALRAIDVLTEAGFVVDGCIAVVKRQGDSFKDIKRRVTWAKALTTLHDVEAAHE